MTTQANPAWMTWTGRVVSGLAGLMVVFSASMKLMHSPEVVQGFAHFGFPEGVITPIAIVELACVLIYLVPQTAVLGAILTSAYFGGAVVTHVRLEEGFVAPVLVAVALWAGLWLRDPALRALAPLRRA